MDAVFSWITQYGYAGLFILLMFGIVGLPVPDETLLVFCGYLIWKRHLEAVSTLLAGFAGSISGITLSYWMGRTYGHRIIGKYGNLIGATDDRVARVHRWFGRFGLWLLAIGYFVPGVRHFTALVAGAAELEFGPFALFAYAGAAVWVTFFLTLGYAVGESWHRTSEVFNRYAAIFTIFAVIIAIVIWSIRRNRSNNA